MDHGMMAWRQRVSGMEGAGMKRVVTGVNEQGRSCVLSIEELEIPEVGAVVWEYKPSDILKSMRAIDPGAAATWIEPEVSGGVRWYLAAFPPGAPVPELPVVDKEGFHTTRTLDSVCVVEGELLLLLEEDRVPLKKGDFVIQQATRHAWRNESDITAITLGVVHRPSEV
jgi:hypothetical protein